MKRMRRMNAARSPIVVKLLRRSRATERTDNHGKMQLVLNTPLLFALIRVIRELTSSKETNAAHEYRPFTNRRKTSSPFPRHR
jgi:hypothetical protein